MSKNIFGSDSYITGTPAPAPAAPAPAAPRITDNRVNILGPTIASNDYVGKVGRDVIRDTPKK